MAKRGSVKSWSVIQEEFVAKLYGGVRSKSSGGAAHDNGDVRAALELIECKYTGSPTQPLKAKPKILKEFEKISREAEAEGRIPMLALRYFWPESPLADRDGWVDLSVRQARYDAERAYDQA